PLFASNDRKSVLDFPLASLRFPKSDRLLGSCRVSVKKPTSPHMEVVLYYASTPLTLSKEQKLSKPSLLAIWVSPP
ncbi:MAG: hypothetical protein ACREX9_01795, partial [Gammaproteobacteria bacterium]